MSFKPLSPTIFTLLARALYRGVMQEPATTKIALGVAFAPVVADGIRLSQPNSEPLSKFLAGLEHSCYFPLILKGKFENHIVFAQYDPGDNDMNPQLFIDDSKTVPQASRSSSALGLHADVYVEYNTDMSQSAIDATSCGYRTLAAILSELSYVGGSNKLSRVQAFEVLMEALKMAASPVYIDDVREIENTNDVALRVAGSIRSEIALAKQNHDQAGNLTEAFLREFSKTPATKALETASLAKKDSNTPGQRVLDFMGFPKSGLAQRVLYFLSLGFVFRPIISTVKIFTEFLPASIDKTLGVLEGALKAYIPLASDKAKNPRAINAVIGIKSGARSAALGVVYTLRGIFATLSFIGGLLTSPVETASRLWQGKTAIKNPILRKIFAVGSGLLSLGIWTTILFFTLPLALPALASAIPAIAPAVSTLLAAFSTPLLTMAAASAAVLTAVIIRLGNVIAKKIDEPKPSRLDRALAYDIMADPNLGNFTHVGAEAPRATEPPKVAYVSPVTGQKLRCEPHKPVVKTPESQVPQTGADPDNSDAPPPRVQKVSPNP